MAFKTIVTTERREKARDAAEELCRKVRLDVAQYGCITRYAMVYLHRWMRLSGGGSAYRPPKPLRKRTKKGGES